MVSHASAAHVVPYVTSKSTILSGVLYAEQTLHVEKKPSSLLPREDKRPDGLTLGPWQGGHCLACDAALVDTLAPSYVAVTDQVTRSAAQAAAERKVSKYAGLSASHLFVPIAIETFDLINEAGHSFLFELESRLSTISDDPRESFFLFQRISILIQRFNEAEARF